MANLSPKTEQLELGRGKRPKLDHKTVSMRMSEETENKVKQIALQYDCTYDGDGQISGLLKKIADGELLVVPAPPSDCPNYVNSTAARQARRRLGLPRKTDTVK